MGDLPRVARELATCEQYRALLAVAEAIGAHRDLRALFHDLAGRLHHVVHFDYLILVLHDEAQKMMRLHVLETSEPTSPRPGLLLPVDESPSGLVLTTQKPVIVPDVSQAHRWPRLWDALRPYDV